MKRDDLIKLLERNFTPNENIEVQACLCVESDDEDFDYDIDKSTLFIMGVRYDKNGKPVIVAAQADIIGDIEYEMIHGEDARKIIFSV